MLKPSAGPWKITHTEQMGYRVSDSTGWGVALVLKDTNDDANARLIGAAPQMLEALEAITKRFQPEQHDAAGCMFKNCELCKAIAVIKAAKGEV